MAGTTGRRGGGRRGVTLLEMLIALVILALVTAAGAQGLRRYRGAVALERAGDAARSRLGHARMLGVTRRAVVTVRIESPGTMVLREPDGSVAGVTPLAGPFGLDSLRLRPTVLRFNARGQASPGSLYLYRGRHGVRLVSNFVGRVRVERFDVP